MQCQLRSACRRVINDFPVVVTNSSEFVYIGRCWMEGWNSYDIILGLILASLLTAEGKARNVFYASWSLE